MICGLNKFLSRHMRYTVWVHCCKRPNYVSWQIHQNTTFVFIVIIDVSATAAAFVRTTVYQVLLWRRVSNHRRVEVRRTLVSAHRLVLFFRMCIASLIHRSILLLSLSIQRDVRAYTRTTSKSTATEQNKSAVTDHAISLNHVIDWDRTKLIDRESSRMNRWIREAIHNKKGQDKSMNRDEGSYQLSHINDYLLSATATPGGQSFRRRQQRLPKRQQQQWIQRLYFDEFVSWTFLDAESRALVAFPVKC